jgi:hypothetical protein
MRLNFLSAVLLALPLPAAAALLCGKTHIGCGTTDMACTTSNGCDESECCQQETTAAVPKPVGKTDAKPTDPSRQIVFKVEGLTCPAVKGIGCGHMLYGLLASLDKLHGIEASSANYTGTLVRVSVTKATDRDKVAEAVRKVLTEENHKAVLLAGDELKRALDREEWRGAARIGELSAIEFHTLALHRFKTFAKAEKLDKKTTDKLVLLVERQWERLSQEANTEGATRPEDWGKRIRASLPVFLEGAKDVLSDEQVERLKQTLTGQCADGDCPEAPPAPARAKKAA